MECRKSTPTFSPGMKPLFNRPFDEWRNTKAPRPDLRITEQIFATHYGQNGSTAESERRLADRIVLTPKSL